jgi:hypothetical protein
MKTIVLIVLSFCSACMPGQENARADFKKINETFAGTSLFSMDIKYELFLDGSSTAYETESGKYIKDHKKYYSMQSGNEIVITASCMYVIDKERKVLAADKKIDERKLEDPLSQNLDSLFVLYSKIEVINTGSPSVKAYRFYIKEGPYSICEVYFNAKTNFVTEIRNVFRNKISDENDKERSAVLRTTFYNINLKPSLQNMFDDGKYIKKVNGAYVPGESYKSYRLINHLK